MGSKEWRAAAKLASSKDKRPEPDPAEINKAIRELEEFMKSDEGEAAKELLAATGRHIILGEAPGAGSVTVYFLNDKGLQQSIEVTGSAAAYSRQQPRVHAILADAAIKAATHPEIGAKQPEEVMPFLRAELDKIAEGIKEG
jgi:hypothetical protein